MVNKHIDKDTESEAKYDVETSIERNVMSYQMLTITN